MILIVTKEVMKMYKNILITNILQIISKPQLIIGIIAFVIFSYFFIALLTWSLIKPLKYLSTSFFIIGIIILIFRFTFPTIITSVLQNELNIPSTILNVILNPFLRSGIICIIIGILFITTYIIIGKLKINKTKKDRL